MTDSIKIKKKTKKQTTKEQSFHSTTAQPAPEVLTGQSKAIFTVYMLIAVDESTVHVIIFIIVHVKGSSHSKTHCMHDFQAVINCWLAQFSSFVPSI